MAALAFQVEEYFAANDNFARAANALNQVANVPNRAPMTWSDAGNMQTDGKGTTFVHDGNNRLIKATKANSDTYHFRYDGDGLRMETIKNPDPTLSANFQHTGGTKTRYVTSATEEIADLDGNRVVLRRYIAGPAIDERVAQVDATGTVTYIHTDKQNSVVALSNSSGAAVSRRGYGTYGETNPTQMAETTHPFGYTGRRYESDLGLYYYRARWYDPELGTFLQTDPIGSLDYINLYSYVGLNPMNATDPTGMMPDFGAPLPPPPPPSIGHNGGPPLVEQSSPEKGANPPNPLQIVSKTPMVAAAVFLFTPTATSVGANGPILPQVNIEAHEGGTWAGHTMEKHVGKDLPYLQGRVSSGLPAASSFDSVTQANNNISQALRQNNTAIHNEIANGANRIVVEGNTSGGVTVFRSSNGAMISQASNGTRVVITITSNGPKIITAYPIVR